MKKISPTACFLVIVLIVMTVVFVTSLGYRELNVKLMPLIVSGFTIVLSAFALVQDLRTGSEHTKATDEEGEEIEEDDGVTLRGLFRAFVWFAALVAAVYVFGFAVAMPAWIAFYLWKSGHRWWTSIILGITPLIIVYLIFTVLFEIKLYPGIVFAWLSH
ncbi:MAG TPA: tripartite tricarboxylate transporter TctB family protein [Anaerolineae bacterium]|nr:tripartite tricarboxylate transporter TctB family protein [Anaerolineae bacterium]HPL29521.1 tripartite tricarboxylate transporter TctB family protein [Anaerolineae bacterium]